MDTFVMVAFVEVVLAAVFTVVLIIVIMNIIIIIRQEVSIKNPENGKNRVPREEKNPRKKTKIYHSKKNVFLIFKILEYGLLPEVSISHC